MPFLPPPCAVTASWFNLLSANDFSDGNPMHWMRAQHNKHCFIHISMNQTKLTLAGLLHAGGSSCLIITGNDPEFNVPFAFTTKLPKELRTTWICHALWSYSFLDSLWSHVCHKPQDMVTACKLCDIQILNSDLTQSLWLRICFHLCHTYFRCFTVIYLEGYKQLQKQRHKLSSKSQINVDVILPKVCYFFPICF